MLKLLKKISPRHEDLFIEHYQRLRAWSLQLTEHDRDLAEDLLHDAFIHFTTLTQPDLKSIHNLDGYFYGMLRNLHLSQERRSSRSRFQQLSIVEYESAATGLRVIDTRDAIQVQDELRRICLYACARKETAKLASVLILRFFHGYYPSEIARILRSPRPAIDKWLQLARAEAKLSINDFSSPNSLRFKDAIPPVEFLPASIARTSEDLLRELQEQIFQARHGDCTTKDNLARFYQVKESSPMDCAQLSHVVSCQECLDEINVMLNLPSLSDRYPTDSIGKDTTHKDGGDGGSGAGGTGGGDSPKAAVRKYQSRAREAFEHRPQELCVSVNGYIQGSHRIGSDKVELDLSANLAEAVSFVEVFSEQGIRLLLLNAEEPPPHGPDVQSSRAKLSDGRTLALTLKLRSPWPTLHLVYNDPTFKAVESGIWNEVQNRGSSSTVREDSDFQVQSPKSKVQGAVNPIFPFKQRFRARLADIGHWALDLGLFLRPATVTVVLAALLLTVALFFSLRKPAAPLTAGELLARASVAEEVLAGRSDQVIHRTLNFEERKTNGELLARRKIEIWQSAEKRITARRLYDERGALIAGDWRGADGVQTLYHHGARPRLQLAPDKRGIGTVGFDSVWHLDLTAKEFTSLIGNDESAQVEETAGNYVITYNTQTSASSPGIVKATLVLSRADLRAIEQTLVARQDDQIREYRFAETSFERRRSDSVAPSVFEPDPELLSSAMGSTPSAPPGTPLPGSNTPPPSSVLATAALEVEVIDLLNNAGAFMGEQISVQRTGDNRLQVRALVETDKRKAELLNALVSVKGNPAVQINIETVAEAQAREARQKKSNQTQSGVTVDRYEATENTSPVYEDLRKKFDEAGARAFADRILRRSQQARRHALAMKQLSDRFSIADLQSLTPVERMRWLSLLGGHAQKYISETESLKRELQTIFPDLGGGGGARELDSDREIQASVRQLYDLSVACDEDLRASFALVANSVSAAEIKSGKFWRALNTAAALARSLQSAR